MKEFVTRTPENDEEMENSNINMCHAGHSSDSDSDMWRLFSENVLDTDKDVEIIQSENIWQSAAEEIPEMFELSIEVIQQKNAAILNEILQLTNISDRVGIKECEDVFDEFASFKDFSECGIEGFVKKYALSQYQAVFLMLITQISYNRNTCLDFVGMRMYSWFQIAEILISLFKDEQEESIHILFVDSDLTVLGHVVKKGSFSSATLTIRDIALHRPYIKKCGIYIAHNHTNGNALPSYEDIELMKSVKKIHDSLNVKLLDSFIVTDKTVYSMKLNRFYTIER